MTSTILMKRPSRINKSRALLGVLVLFLFMKT